MAAPLAPLLVRDLARTFPDRPDRPVLDGVDLTVTPGRPVGLIGENGSGKSTLLRCVVGLDTPDHGHVSLPGEVGYVGQDAPFAREATVAEVLADALAPLHDLVRRVEAPGDLTDPVVAAAYARDLEAAQARDAWDADRRAAEAAERLGLGALSGNRAVGSLSGGQRSRLALAAAIAARPTCLVLDEPTNHLDAPAMEFLESALIALPGVVLVASHDRVFLDRVCTTLVDLDLSHFGTDGVGGATYSGDFSDYLAHRRAASERWHEAFLRQREELADLRAAATTTDRDVAHGRGPRDNDKFIHAFKGSRVDATARRRRRNAEQRIAAVERDLIPKPPAELSFRGGLTTGGSPGQVLTVRDLEVTGRLRVPRLDLAAGDHLLVTGPNGCGKSTLLHVLAERLRPDAGSVRVAARRTGLLPQDVTWAAPERSAAQVYAAAAPASAPTLSALGLLPAREHHRPVGALSVGQQRRLALALLIARAPDLLLLDEPTNHLSLALATELEEALDRSPGTVVIASHDRWLRARWTGAELALGSGG